MTMRFVLLAVTSSALFAQPPRPSFEVASIKPNNSGSGHSDSHRTNGRFTSSNVTLKRYIARAYNLDDDQISGPDWLATEHFDIVAKAPAAADNDHIALMLQSLLEDRFKLALHRETREMRAYALVVAKNGSKLTPAVDDGSSSTNTHNSHMTAHHVSMEHLASALTRSTGLRVVDMTGLHGVFDFTLEWDPSSTSLSPGDPPAKTDAPSIFTALEEQLGLKLEPRKLPVEILVIDHIEKTPTDN